MTGKSQKGGIAKADKKRIKDEVTIMPLGIPINPHNPRVNPYVKEKDADKWLPYPIIRD